MWGSRDQVPAQRSSLKDRAGYFYKGKITYFLKCIIDLNKRHEYRLEITLGEKISKLALTGKVFREWHCVGRLTDKELKFLCGIYAAL